MVKKKNSVENALGAIPDNNQVKNYYLAFIDNTN